MDRRKNTAFYLPDYKDAHYQRLASKRPGAAFCPAVEEFSQYLTLRRSFAAYPALVRDSVATSG